MNYGGKHGYSLARSHRVIFHMGSPVLHKSSHSHHGALKRSSHGGHTETNGKLHIFNQEGLQESHHGRSYIYTKVDPKAFCHGSAQVFLHIGHQKTSDKCNVPSVTKYSSGYKVHNNSNQSGALENNKHHKNNGLFDYNQKDTMRNLNERLLSYLKEVYSLEQDNERLEHKIAKWYENNAPGKPADYSQHFETILDLQNQISTAFKNNVRIIRNIDNSKFNVNDYNNKYEMELSMRRSIDADVTRQRGILEGYNDQIVMLESEVDKLQGEMLKIRRDSEQGINSLTSQLGTRVSVEVEASPSSDLKKALSGIRDEYEKLMEESLRDLENIFRQRSKKLNHQLAFGSERLQSAHTEPIDVKHSLLMMEIELQSEQNMISTLEDTLVEKQAYYVSEFAQLQDMIQSTENQLDKIRTELEIQNGEYERLLDNKTYLEQEIAIYQCLLDENGLQVPESLPTSNQIEQNSNEDMKDEVNTED